MKHFEDENIEDFIKDMLSTAITEEMLWTCKIKSFIDGIKFRFSREEIEHMIKLTSEEEFLEYLDTLIQKKYNIKGINKDFYLRKLKEIITKIDSEKEKWKIVEGKKLRNTILQEMKKRKGITINFEKIENLMMYDEFTVKNLISPIESYFNCR